MNTQNKAQHTPTPWRSVRYTNAGEFVTETKIVSNDGSVIARLGPCSINENAAFIEEACNNYEAILYQRNALREALQMLLEATGEHAYGDLRDECRAALAKAQDRS